MSTCTNKIASFGQSVPIEIGENNMLHELSSEEGQNTSCDVSTYLLVFRLQFFQYFPSFPKGKEHLNVHCYLIKSSFFNCNSYIINTSSFQTKMMSVECLPCDQ